MDHILRHFPPPTRTLIHPSAVRLHRSFPTALPASHSGHQKAGYRRKLVWGVVPPSTYYYSTEQSSVDTVFHSILTTEDVTGREECRSSKSGNEGRTGEFQGIKVRRQSNRGKFILERKQRNYRGATEHESCAASV